MSTKSAIRSLFALAAVTMIGISPAQADVQTDFFRAIQSGDVRQVVSQMRPELLVEVDEPVLAAWMNALNERLGSVLSIEYTGLELNQTEHGPMRATTAIITFQKGAAKSSLTTLGDKLLGFDVTSEELGGDWFQGPTSTKLYQKLGRTFIERFFTGQTDDAYAMCHEALQKVIDRESFEQMIAIVHTKCGDLQKIAFKESRMDISENSQNLLLTYEIVGEKLTTTCEIKVQFVGMKGHLLGFNFE